MKLRKKPEIQTKIVLDTRFKNKNLRSPVKLRIYYPGGPKKNKYRYYTIKGQNYTEKEFNIIINPATKKKYIQLEKDRKVQISKIRELFYAIDTKAIKIVDETLVNFSFEAFEKEFRGNQKKDNTIHGYFEAKAADLDSANKIQTATLYRATLKSLLMYDSKISFEKITPAYLKKYEDHMVEHGHAYSTIGIYLRHFKHIINLAIQDKIGIEYPFGKHKDKYQIPTAKNIKKALTLDEIESLFLYKPENHNEYLAQQYFLFSYLCNGMNFIDMANLRFKNIKENKIQFIRKKTKDTTKNKTLIYVSLIPQIKNIIDSIGNQNNDPESYIFPIFAPDFTELDKHNRIKQFIKNTNKYLKQIAVKIGISENITTYWARHTYSTVLKRSGTPIEFIAEQLGHTSTKITASYLDSFEDEQREKYAQNTLPESMKKFNS